MPDAPPTETEDMPTAGETVADMPMPTAAHVRIGTVREVLAIGRGDGGQRKWIRYRPDRLCHLHVAPGERAAFVTVARELAMPLEAPPFLTIGAVYQMTYVREPVGTAFVHPFETYPLLAVARGAAVLFPVQVNGDHQFLG